MNAARSARSSRGSTTIPASGVTISGWFNGAPDANNIWHNAGYYSYKLSFDGTYFWLKPEATRQIKGSIRFLPDGSTGLTNDIYATYGTADIVGPNGNVFLSQMNVGANNEWGAVLRDFLTGFTAGYYGGTGTSPCSTSSKTSTS